MPHTAESRIDRVALRVGEAWSRDLVDLRGRFDPKTSWSGRDEKATLDCEDTFIAVWPVAETDVSGRRVGVGVPVGRSTATQPLIQGDRKPHNASLHRVQARALTWSPMYKLCLSTAALISHDETVGPDARIRPGARVRSDLGGRPGPTESTHPPLAAAAVALGRLGARVLRVDMRCGRALASGPRPGYRGRPRVSDGDPRDEQCWRRIGNPRPDRTAFLRGIGRAPGGARRDARPGLAHEEKRQAATVSVESVRDELKALAQGGEASRG